MMKNLLFYFLFFLSFSLVSQNNDWIKKTPFGGGKRERAVGFSIGNKGYISTGQDSSNLMNKDLWEYDPVDNIWTQKTDFPGLARRNAVGFAVGNKGYVGLGITHADAYSGVKQKDMWEYNPQTNTWLQKAQYPGNAGAGLYYATAFVINNLAYVCGGKNGPSTYSNQLWSFNPATNQWVYVSAFPGVKMERYGLIGVGVNGKAYIGLGANEDNYQNDWWEYDPQTNTWTKKLNFPGTPRMGSIGFELNGRAYVGLGIDGGYKDDFYEYNPTTNKWFIKENYDGGGRRGAVSFVIDKFGYVGTGKSETGTKQNFYQYWPGSPNSEEELEFNIDVSVFPNPMIENSTISFADKSTEYTVQLLQNNGQVIKTIFNCVGNIEFNRENISPGIYFLKISDNDYSNKNKTVIKKIVVL